ncbi:uncharacterized protein LOC133472279 [Phyllopteryx taeniolatus]|uniref:uncharacterized protein LOC133472279 n=1 Tax=Phyllopteryx taeniolatus TaxID=161469 RepID=UPI002AD39069|nr:uncharacterized protein LOC133472279 [Phyllopteryx taeniolatus]
MLDSEIRCSQDPQVLYLLGPGYLHVLHAHVHQVALKILDLLKWWKHGVMVNFLSNMLSPSAIRDSASKILYMQKVSWRSLHHRRVFRRRLIRRRFLLSRSNGFGRRLRSTVNHKKCKWRPWALDGTCFEMSSFHNWVFFDPVFCFSTFLPELQRNTCQLPGHSAVRVLKGPENKSPVFLAGPHTGPRSRHTGRPLHQAATRRRLLMSSDFDLVSFVISCLLLNIYSAKKIKVYYNT